jgi:anaerobic magnesium-protoporphyrin IX monomethyl ester cyclase
MGAENLGVEYLAAAARVAGHEASLAFDPAVFGGRLMWDIPALARVFDLRPKIIARIRRERPDAVAFSCFTGNYQWSLSIAREIKKFDPAIATLFGGVHVTAVPDRVLAEDAVDAVAVGESDAAFARLLEHVARPDESEVPPGSRVKRGGRIECGPPAELIGDLDSLPLPAKDLFYEKAPALQRHYMIMTARGCPYSCTYCYKSLSAALPAGANPVRRRSAGNVISELEEEASRCKIEMVVFRDDVFTLNKRWLAEFTEEYKNKIGLPYFCYTHPAALDEETADLIKAGGCRFVTLGIQSADAEQRRRVLNRNYSNDRARCTVSLLKKRGIFVSADHIIGLPGDNPQLLREAVSFYNELRPDRLLTFWLEYYPGTRIMRTALEAGLITESDRERIELGYGGHRYSGGGAAGARTDIARFPAFLALVSILPPGIVRWLLKRNAEKRLPRAFWFHNILLSLNALLKRDPFFFYNLRFFISRKKAP